MLKLELPKIYPITDARISGLSHTEQVKRLVAGGASLIQLREKHLTPKEFYEDAKSAVEFAREHGVLILINDRVDIAMALDADGVHLGQTDLAPDRARTLLGHKKIVGFSTHSVAQALEASLLGIDYLAIGPVYTTSTKENPDPVVGLDGVRRVRDAIGDLPLVGIGGIRKDNFSEVLRAGADSIAIISDILGSQKDITERFKGLVDAVALV